MYRQVMMLRGVVLGLTLSVHSAYALDFKPYPAADITKTQWQAYHASVKQHFGASRQDHLHERLTTYSHESTRMNFAFTMPGHRAHPAWITRQLVESGGTVDMAQIGYFAGDEEPFAELFRQYQQLNEQIMSRFEKQQ